MEMTYLDKQRIARSIKFYRTGFTLVELVMSLVIMTVLVVGISSAVAIASRAIDSEESTAAQTPSALFVMNQITDDLTFALSFTQRTSNIVEFTVPDRSGDALPETIRYAWSGTPGDVLTRTYNGGLAVVVLDSVENFDLTYLLRTIGPPTEACCYLGGACLDELPTACQANGGIAQGPNSDCLSVTCPTTVESGEVVLIFHDDAAGGAMASHPVTSADWVGTYFFPSLPINTLSWKITRIQLMAEKSGNGNGVVGVQIRTADAGLLPTTTVLEQASLLESALSNTFAWTNISYNTLTTLDPTQALCIVAQYTSGSSTVMVFEREDGAGPMTANAHQVQTTTSGASWQATANTDLRFYVYGTYTTDGLPQW